MFEDIFFAIAYGIMGLIHDRRERRKFCVKAE